MIHPDNEGDSPRTVVQVPTGPAPGYLGQLAQLTGVLEGGATEPDSYCLWIRSAKGRRVPVLWPAGYHARIDPLELLNASGQIVARAGDHLVLGGGIRPVDPADPCSLGQAQAFHVQHEMPESRFGNQLKLGYRACAGFAVDRQRQDPVRCK